MEGNGYQDGLGDDPNSRMLVDALSEQLGVEKKQIYRSSNLFAEPLKADSLDVVEIGMQVEDLAGLPYNSIPDETVTGWGTVGQIVDYLTAETQKRD